MDGESGLYYLRARYYDSHLGRFISEDSYWGEDSNSLSLNRYTYCENDPIRYVDPSGHAVTDWDKAHLSNVDQDLLGDLTNKWNDYNSKGDTSATDSIHALAEKIRDKYRTSGEVGSDTGETLRRIGTVKKNDDNIVINKSHSTSADNVKDIFLSL